MTLRMQDTELGMGAFSPRHLGGPSESGKSAIVYAFAKDYKKMARDCRESFWHFHPNVEFRIYDWADAMRICREDGKPCEYYFTHIGKKVHKEGYRTVVHIDGDILVTAPLTRLIYPPAGIDIVGTRGASDLGVGELDYIRGNTLSGEPIGVFEECNAGVFSVTNPAVWDTWEDCNRRYGLKMPMVEQDSFNDIFWSGRYSVEFLDPPSSGEFWNTATKWGDDNGLGGSAGYLDSWRGLYVAQDIDVFDEGGYVSGAGELPLALWLRSPVPPHTPKRVRLLHMAGGQWPNKEAGFDAPDIREKFSPEGWAYLKKVRSEGSVLPEFRNMSGR